MVGGVEVGSNVVNIPTLDAPRYVAAAINAASGPLGAKRLFIRSERAQEWLCENLGLCTVDNESTVCGYTVDFDWHLQRWYVRF